MSRLHNVIKSTDARIDLAWGSQHIRGFYKSMMDAQAVAASEAEYRKLLPVERTSEGTPKGESDAGDRCDRNVARGASPDDVEWI